MAEQAGGEDGERGLLVTANVRLVLEPVEARSLPVHVPRCRVAFAFYTFQSSREWKRKDLNYWGQNQALDSAVQCRHPGKSVFHQSPPKGS